MFNSKIDSENLESFFDTKQCLMKEKISKSIEKLNNVQGYDDLPSKVEGLTKCMKEVEEIRSIPNEDFQKVNNFEGKMISLRYLQEETREFFE
jgi:hypothetical protein